MNDIHGCHQKFDLSRSPPVMEKSSTHPGGQVAGDGRAKRAWGSENA
jgi:hypothetical protein